MTSNYHFKKIKNFPRKRNDNNYIYSRSITFQGKTVEKQGMHQSWQLHFRNPVRHFIVVDVVVVVIVVVVTDVVAVLIKIFLAVEMQGCCGC